MSTRPVVNKLSLASLNRRIDKNFRGTKAKGLKLFARKYYASSAVSDLSKLSDQQIYESAMNGWKFIQQRKSRSPKIQFVHQKSSLDKQHKAGTNIYILLNDMPFLVDSIRQALNRSEIIVRSVNNAVLQVERFSSTRKNAGHLKNLAVNKSEGYRAEALICINCTPMAELQCKLIEKEIRDTLKHVAAAVKDFKPMCNKATAVRESLLARSKSVPVSPGELRESCEFISWLLNNHFTFLGYEAYRIKNLKRGPVIELQKDALLGISRLKSGLKQRVTLKSLPAGTGDLILRKQVCNFSKSSTRSKIHRPAHYDYVLIKEFDKQGNVAIEHRFLGLYTSSVYYRAALEIPLIRNKVNAVLDRSGFSPNGHSIKNLLQVINVFPRDELFQISEGQLFTTALEITQIQETRTSKLFIRKDAYGKFFSCLVYVPRDIYTTEVRIKIQRFLQQHLSAEEVEFTTYFSESVLARLHFVMRVPEIHRVKYKLAELENSIIQLIKPWDDSFLDVLLQLYPDSEAGRLQKVYTRCYSAAYKEVYSAEEAVKDIARIDNVVASQDLALDLNTCSSEIGVELSFKIFSYRHQLFLSDVVPILENLGLNIISEKAFKLQPGSDHTVWLHDFSLYRKRKSGDVFCEELKNKFEAAFNAIWHEKIDDDTFNELVITGRVGWRDAALIRAYSAYLKQIQFGYSAQFIAATLSQHEPIAKLLIRYFYCLFDPALKQSERRNAKQLSRKILTAIDGVENLSEDGVLRTFLSLFEATLRTNYFQSAESGEHKHYFSFKINPEQLDGMPLPKPKFEIFVFSRQMEGVHLRGGRVARGGLRWSDRREDYRTEVLGLVKAQQVKNSVIVPVGAKGGFVVKQPVPPLDREQYMSSGIDCYQTFICGLLDITDNIVDGKLQPPAKVVRRDGDDPYLVVAADKGTATFSDIANRIALDYTFWLGDGFASGGSNGYDHKQMGITARGAWVSVQRHFRELGINIQKQDFSVVGIGDMSGDVFGNGMLLSRHIRLLAAFNHLHIFIDPNPDSASSYRERARLFRTSRSSWADYNAKLISTGGGVFPRRAKSIAITKQMQARFGIEKDKVTPDQLISLLLSSPVDLIWNGGIGTYVKASRENHAEVGDKTNDAVRVNGSELRCKVIGEGGNLGLTQAARVEYGLRGGVSLTDFIDNSAGVDCSDHEVNIKILLNELQSKNRLTERRRNSLLQSMTDNVADLVLANNYSQVQTIGTAQTQMDVRHKEYADLISYLEKYAGLDRGLEFLPNKEQLEERASRALYLTRPEISVITSYMKMHLKAELAEVEYLDDAYLLPCLYSAFPAKLIQPYKLAIQAHTLRREIVATQLANSIVNLLGPSFIYRMVESTASSLAEVVKAAVIARDVFQVQQYWREIEELDYKIATATQAEMISRLIRLIRRVTRWLLRNRRSNLTLTDEVRFFTSRVSQFRRMLPAKLPPDFALMYQEKYANLTDNDVPDKLAVEICQSDFLFPATSFIEISNASGEPLGNVVDIYYAIGEQLQLNWLGKIINKLPVANYWQALARETYLDDLAWQQRALTDNVVKSVSRRSAARTRVALWVADNAVPVSRTSNILAQLQAESQPDYAMFSVAMRELLTLAQATARNT